MEQLAELLEATVGAGVSVKMLGERHDPEEELENFGR
jgi:hypothetical protein